MLAQAPIEGWDKAKFGMSPEELKEVYAQEDKYFTEKEGKYYATEAKIMAWISKYPEAKRTKAEAYIDRIVNAKTEEERKKIYEIEWAKLLEPEKAWTLRIGKRIKKLKGQLPEETIPKLKSTFWSVEEGNKFKKPPYELHTSKLKVLGVKADVYFLFVGDRLFGITILGEKIYEEKELSLLKSTLAKLKDKLITKYGPPVNKETSKEKESFEWEGPDDNLLSVEIWLTTSSRWASFSSYTIKYRDRELTTLWERRVTKWEKE